MPAGEPLVAAGECRGCPGRGCLDLSVVVAVRVVYRAVGLAPSWTTVPLPVSRSAPFRMAGWLVFVGKKFWNRAPGLERLAASPTVWAFRLVAVAGRRLFPRWEHRSLGRAGL